MTQETGLVHFDAARQELVLATSIDEIKTIRDKAEALRQYIKQQGASLEMQNQAAEIKLRAERRAGEMLSETEFNTGTQGQLVGKDASGGYIVQPLEDLPKLSELGITKIQSFRWQLEASIPEDKFEAFIAETKADAEELTSKATLKLAKLIKHEEQKLITSDCSIPDGLFDVIAIDPPWPYGRKYDPDSSRVASPYNEMPIEELLLLQIPSYDDCVLWLWTTNTFMHEAYHILESWQFEPKTILTWYKERTGVGHILRGDTEHCIVATQGNPKFTHIAQSSFLSAKAGGHSEKPESFYKLVESLCPGSKLEMFARKHREGWEAHGNQL